MRAAVVEQGPQLLEYLRSQREPLAQLMRLLVEAESPSLDPESHKQVHAVLAEALQELGFRVSPVGGFAGASHLYARPEPRRRAQPAQLLIGHYDTVWPLGTLAERPFEIDGEILRGPGVFDMKGGLAQMVFALKALQAQGLEPPLTPVIFVNADEEIGSRSSTRYIRLLAARVQRAFVLEPALGSEGLLKTTRKGVGRFTITVHGKAAHAGLDPEGGASAILEMSHVIQSLFALNDAERGVSVNVGTVDGGMHPNVIAPQCQAVVDVRVPSGDDAARVEAEILGLTASTPGVRVRASGMIGRPPLEPTARNEALWRRARAHAAELGIEIGAGRAGGGSDGNTTSQYTATLDGLGSVGDGAHAVHEHIHLGKSIERAALLALLLCSAPLAQQREA